MSADKKAKMSLGMKIWTSIFWLFIGLLVLGYCADHSDNKKDEAQEFRSHPLKAYRIDYHGDPKYRPIAEEAMRILFKKCGGTETLISLVGSVQLSYDSVNSYTLKKYGWKNEISIDSATETSNEARAVIPSTFMFLNHLMFRIGLTKHPGILMSEGMARWLCWQPYNRIMDVDGQYTDGYDTFLSVPELGTLTKHP